MAAGARRRGSFKGSSRVPVAMDVMSEVATYGSHTIGARFLIEADRSAIPSDWSSIRRQLAQCLRSGLCQGAISAFICITIVFVVVDTNTRAEHTSRPRWLSHCNHAVFLIYFAEITVRLFVERVEFFTKGWNLFDLAVVLADVVSLLTEALFGHLETSFSWLRLLRIMRVLRLFRVFKRFNELNMLVHGIASALKAIFWATIMMLMCLLGWSIVAVEVIQPVVEKHTHAGGFKECPRCKYAFSSVSQAFLTFVQTIVAGDSWGTYAIPVIDESPATFFIFILVTATIQFGLMNLILAVIVDRAQQARLDDTEMQLGALQDKFIEAKRSLLKWCKEMDLEGKGYISRQDLLNGWGRIDEFRDAMKLWNLSQKDLDVVFEVLDTDNSNTLTYAEFVEQLFTLTNADLNTIFVYTLHHMNRMMDFHTARFEEALSGKSNNSFGLRSRASRTDSALGEFHGEDHEIIRPQSPIVERQPVSKPSNAITRGLETAAADKANASGEFHQVSNQGVYRDLVTVPIFDELREVGDKSWAESLDDFGASMLSLQSNIEHDLNRLRDTIQDQDAELKKMGEDLLTHLHYAPRVLPEQCFRKHGDLLERLQEMESTLRESAYTILVHIGRQTATIAEMEGFIVHKAGADPKWGKPGMVFL